MFESIILTNINHILSGCWCFRLKKSFGLVKYFTSGFLFSVSGCPLADKTLKSLMAANSQELK